jgi:hypothetical protein
LGDDSGPAVELLLDSAIHQSWLDVNGFGDDCRGCSTSCVAWLGLLDLAPMATDTTAAAQEAQVLAARRLGPAGRLRAAAELSEDIRRISVEGVLRRHPGYSLEQARREVLARIWGEDLARRVWPSTRP